MYLFLATLSLFSSCSSQASHCGFSLRRIFFLWLSTGSGLQTSMAGALEHRLNSCSTQTQLLHGMWGLPGSGIEPVSLALAGGFCTMEPQGSPKLNFIPNKNIFYT